MVWSLEVTQNDNVIIQNEFRTAIYEKNKKKLTYLSEDGFTDALENLMMKEIFQCLDGFEFKSILIEKVNCGVVDFSYCDIDFDNIVLEIDGNNSEIINNKFKYIVINGFHKKSDLLEKVLKCDYDFLLLNESRINMNIRRILKSNNNQNIYFNGCYIKAYDHEGFHSYYTSKKVNLISDVNFEFNIFTRNKNIDIPVSQNLFVKVFETIQFQI